MGGSVKSVVRKILRLARPPDDLPSPLCSIRERSFRIRFIKDNLTQLYRTWATKRVYISLRWSWTLKVFQSGSICPGTEQGSSGAAPKDDRASLIGWAAQTRPGELGHREDVQFAHISRSCILHASSHLFPTTSTTIGCGGVFLSS